MALVLKEVFYLDFGPKCVILELMFKVGQIVYDKATKQFMKISEIIYYNQYRDFKLTNKDGLYLMPRSEDSIFIPTKLEKLIYGINDSL